MGKVYNRETQVLAGVCSVGVCMMFAAYLAKVGGILLEQVTGLSFTGGVVVFTVAAVFYTVYGGLRATVLTDTIQFIIFALVIPFIALAAFFHPSFDVHRASTAVIDLSHQAWTKDTILGITGVALAFLLGETLIPPRI